MPSFTFISSPEIMWRFVTIYPSFEKITPEPMPLLLLENELFLTDKGVLAFGLSFELFGLE